MSTVASTRNVVFDEQAFQRDDDRDDAFYYKVDRFVPHLDAEALRVVSSIIDALVTEDRPEVLDLMASWDSHLGDERRAERVVGLGLNRHELDANPALDELIVHDLNRDPTLPFADASFDVVLNTVSVDYLTRPFEVVAEVGRVLRPGGLFLVLFSNRFFPEKVVRVWREASGRERTMIVEEYLRSSERFGPSDNMLVHGRPRPEDDRYAFTGLPSDPIYAVWAERKGEKFGRRRQPPDFDPWFVRDPEELERRKRAAAETRECPYCGDRLRKWAVPQTPFTEWDQEHLYICFNDRCPFLLRGWHAMELQGNRGFSYRLMYNPGNERCMPIPIPSLTAFRESIIDEKTPAD